MARACRPFQRSLSPHRGCWQAPDGGGARLAYLLDAAEKEGNGLYLLELAGGRVDPLDASGERYEGLAWSEDGTAVAALRGVTPEGVEQMESLCDPTQDEA